MTFLVSVIIPCFNESNNIESIILSLLKLGRTTSLELILVDDCSSDNSVELVRKFDAVKIIRHGINKGKTACIASALEIASGEIVVIQDADNEYPPENILRLIDPILKNKADIVYGLRDKRPQRFYPTVLGKIVVSSLLRMLYGINIKDVNTGHKAFRSSCLKEIKLQSKRFTFCVEFTILASRQNVKIKEVPVSYFPRTRKEGKKIGFVDGLEIVFYIINSKLKTIF